MIPPEVRAAIDRAFPDPKQREHVIANFPLEAYDKPENRPHRQTIIAKYLRAMAERPSRGKARKKRRKPSETAPVEQTARGLKLILTGGGRMNAERRERIVDRIISDRFKPREKTDYIERLVAANPDSTALALYKRAHRAVLGDMSPRTFKNKVSLAKRKK